jgi:carbonic anhydrase/acetyltransferase-like protein (isoleucine patch superfamily)
MIIGSPAKAVRELTPEQIEGLRQSALHYIENARRFKRCAQAEASRLHFCFLESLRV